MTKTLTIDLRWIDSSGVGVYIKGIMPGIVAQLGNVSIVGIGVRTRIEEFAWSGADNFRIVDCKAGRYSLQEQIQLPWLIPRQTNLFFSPYYTTPLLYRGKLAVTVHDLSHLVVAEIVTNWRKHLYAQTMFRSLRRRASLIFTVSGFSKSELLRFGSTQANIVTTHLGLAEDWSKASLMPVVRSKPYFVCVGNIKPYKNLKRLVEAFLSIQHRVPQDLVIIGQSEGLITGESSEFFETVRSAGVRIQMTGHISQQELLSLVGHADALIMPSLYEGFGLPPIEAMAAGTPAVVAHAGSLPEVCNEAALYFDPLSTQDIADKLIAIASDSELSSRLRARGLVHSRQFNWQSCAERTASALQDSL
jgi:glycosyltransferase involved in cell wall biosynthesis